MRREKYFRASTIIISLGYLHLSRTRVVAEADRMTLLSDLRDSWVEAGFAPAQHDKDSGRPWKDAPRTCSGKKSPNVEVAYRKGGGIFPESALSLHTAATSYVAATMRLMGQPCHGSKKVSIRYR